MSGVRGGKVTKTEEAAKGVPEEDLQELEAVLQHSDSFVLKNYSKAKMVDFLRSYFRRSQQVALLVGCEEVANRRVLELEREVLSTIASKLVLTNQVAQGKADGLAWRAAITEEENTKRKLMLKEMEKQHENVLQALKESRAGERQSAQIAHDSQVATLRTNYMLSTQEQKDNHVRALQTEENIHMSEVNTEKLTHIQELKELTEKLETKCTKILLDSRAHYEGIAAKVRIVHATELRSKETFVSSLQAQLAFQQQQNKSFSDSSVHLVQRNQEAMYQLMYSATHGNNPAPSLSGALKAPVKTDAPASQVHEAPMLQLTDETEGSNTEGPAVFQPSE